jgi:hypothetical protein
MAVGASACALDMVSSFLPCGEPWFAMFFSSTGVQFIFALSYNDTAPEARSGDHPYLRPFLRET